MFVQGAALPTHTGEGRVCAEGSGGARDRTLLTISRRRQRRVSSQHGSATGRGAPSAQSITLPFPKMARRDSPHSKMASERPRPGAVERRRPGCPCGGPGARRAGPCSPWWPGLRTLSGGRGDPHRLRESFTVFSVLRAMNRKQKQAEKARPCGLLKQMPLNKITGRFQLHQEALPHLPVPPLQQTLDRYLLALQPIISPEELSHTQQLVAEFRKPGGVGERLQKGLERRARKTENWLSDWWLKTAYLEYRLPVVVHSSPGVVLPKQDFLDRQGQLRFAAKLIEGILDFKTMIDNETLPVEYMGGKPLCMNQYYQILSSCRIPGPKRDSIVNYAKGKKQSRHITVVHNFQFFELDVYNSDGSPLTADQLFIQLEKIWNTSLQTNKEPIGILTTNHRNSWAKAYNNLLKDKTNKESVRAIEKSICTVCLDAPMPRVSEDIYKSRVAAQMLHGGGSRLNSGNRWFDKTLQFIVAEDGSCGLVYEHAPSEGPPIVALLDHVVEFTKKPETGKSPTVHLPMPKKLRFNITPEIKNDIENAKQNLNIMVEDLDIKVMVFHQFGKGFPKSEKISPDAFIQLALQLAYYRMYSRACATYESASLRMFRLGRTDTIRSTSVDSLKFVQSMDSPDKSDQEKADLLRRATQAHREYTDMAIRGNAIDRHLLGLKLQAIEDLVSMPELFMDTAYAVAMHFNLSTSQVPAKTDCVMCFGPVVPDGYGVCYNPMEEHINFAISAFNSCADTNAARMAHYLEKALLDMRILLQAAPKSKL
ncbi:carnitine O-acetyltransferase isoform X1 [Haemorhous mexicanus]|uniref:carnitine O-acetyltransferase isoform X1 n=2 Tax=Haemorhous mexicanus TaxID=30427 RepID=UPI0028BE3369|nr:carnitine O-acetyltransferase isoform X1 [Haemorhous mexicanus]